MGNSIPSEPGGPAVPQGRQVADDPPRLSPATLDRIRSLSGLTGTTSDILDELGWQLAVRAQTIPLRTHGRQIAVGHAITLRYLPARRNLLEGRQRRSGLANSDVLANAQPGDILVIDANGLEHISVFGGQAALRAANHGLSGVIVEGGIRDIDEIQNLPIWARALTPVTGKWRVEAVAINEPAFCGGVQVCPGDLVVADPTGICFVPGKLAAEVAERIMALSQEEDSARRTAR